MLVIWADTFYLLMNVEVAFLTGTTSGMIVRDVYPGLVCAGTELERMHPKIYTNVTRQACISPSGVLVSDKAAAGLLVAIGNQLLR